MDLAEIFRVMRRRWYILLPGLLLTIGLTVAVALTVPVTYQSQSTVVLLNSEKATKAYDGNPFLSTQTSLTGMADSLARNLNSDVSLRELKSRGATGTFEAKLADNAQGPLMWLTVTGTDKKAVLKSDRLLTEYADERLVEFQKQQSVTENARIRMMTIVAPQNPMAQTKTRLEYMIMAGGLGLVLSLVATFYVEARRRPRPAVRENEPAQPAAEPEPVTGAKESVAEQTMALRTPPSWSRSAEKTRAEGLRAGRNVMTVAPAAEALDEESTHGQRSHTGQRET
ncbi:chain length determinant protein [Streptomyces sp. NBC_00882]|uniref:Wzz/FepE/Etk N-terminal domain-containing protein n=1 Tax=Streptomyces TaxID=1883 RepID=UPI00386FF98B|nr:chain length determinant protein [Streptomyces sp. NBC_00882]WSZ62556.1 chain length determinant protein [Streptomyces canus]